MAEGAKDHDVRIALARVRLEHDAARTAVRRVIDAAREVYNLVQSIRKDLEREFPGISTYASEEWPWDSGHLCPSLVERDPMEMSYGFSIPCGPQGTEFDLGLDRLYYNLLLKPAGFNAPLPVVAWTPRRLAARCAEIEESTRISISIYGEPTSISMSCACGASVPDVKLRGPTPKLDRYEADRLVMCPACNAKLIIFVEGLRHAQ